MYALWMFYGDQFKEVYSPDVGTWTTQVLLDSTDSGLPNDIIFPLRALESYVFAAPPNDYTWADTHKNSERLLKLETPYTFVRNNISILLQLKYIDREDVGFVKYNNRTGTIFIGRGERCDIQDTHGSVSTQHGFLTVHKPDQAEYTDKSSNGTFLNGHKIVHTTVRVQFGDMLMFPSGLKLVYLGKILAVNSKNQLSRVTLSKAAVPQVPSTRPSGDLPSLYVQYHRAPRMLIRKEEQSIEIEPPLAKQAQAYPPLWQQVGPSATMVLPMMTSFLVMSGRSAAGLVMIGTSSALAVMWGLINRRYRKKQDAEMEAKRISLYRQYIAETEATLRELNTREFQRLATTFPNVGECVMLPSQLATHQLWNRMPTHDDFLEVRLGTGEVDLPSSIEFQAQKLSIIDDPLRSEPERLKQIYSHVADAPFTIRLRSESVVGILGDSEAILFAQGLLMQIAALHSYHDVRIVVLTEESTASQWDWARWLPHVFTSEDRDMRMIASKPASVHEITRHLDEVLTMRRGSEEDNQNPSDDEDFDPRSLPLPHYVIFCTNYRLLEDEPVMRKLLTTQLGTTVVMVAPSMEMLPKESHLIINLTSKPGFLHTSEGDTRTVDFEYPNRNLLQQFAQQIAPIRVHDAVESAAIPTLVSFLDIYGVRRVEDLDVWRMWSENRTYEGLRSIIGYTAGSRPFVLDISEKYHGPHGLIAGTTGSGKSVMLQTYILSLALNYSPDQIQFILIDYKGGGMADAFRNLPHVVGIIDNLQGEQVISRALASLNGEIHRRETLFKAMKVSDITEYSKQYGDDPNEVKLPHLIIITDEFAELKSDQPEFMKELVSASRVGRSLGVHLILATQKPSASVSDEIWANSRFHLCLRVQTVADSRDMLKRPDAAYIKGTGRCFIQIGNDESFDQVQTSYSGLTYDPNMPRPEEMPRLLGDVGQPISAPKRRNKADADEKKKTQMEAVLARISEIAQQHGLDHSRQMWLPEMPGKIYFNNLDLFADNHVRDGKFANAPAGVQFLLGLADDTAHQRYIPYVVNLTEIRNLMIVGLAGTGKTTAVQSIVYSLANQYDPEHLQMYILSLSSQTLRPLGEFPHVGDVVFENDNVEIRRLIAMLVREEDRRSELFAAAATDSFIEYNRSCAAQGKPPVPAIVVFVDRFEQLRTMFENDDTTTARISSLIREGSGRGIHFVVTALAKTEVPYKLHDFFTGIALQLSERAAYSDVLPLRVPYEMPPIARMPGRGLAALGKTLYEIQIGLAGLDFKAPQRSEFAGFADLDRYIIEMPLNFEDDLEDSTRADQVKAFASELSERWNGPLPQPIPRIPQQPTWQQFTQEPLYAELLKTPFDIPVGYDFNEGTPAPLNLEENFSLFVTGPRRSGKTNLLKYFALVMQARGAEVHVIGDSEWSAFAKSTGIHLHTTKEEIVAFCEQFNVKELRDHRAPLKRKAMEEGKAALHKLALSLTPYTIIFDNIQRINTEFVDLEQAKNQTFLKTLFSNLFAKGNAYNFQLIASAPFSAQSYFMQDPLRNLISHGRGISLGGKVSDCNALGIAGIIPHSIASKALPTGQGYLLASGLLRQVAIPLAETENE